MRSPELQAERPIAFEVIINLKTAYSSRCHRRCEPPPTR
jgi:hypothetical protein